MVLTPLAKLSKYCMWSNAESIWFLTLPLINPQKPEALSSLVNTEVTLFRQLEMLVITNMKVPTLSWVLATALIRLTMPSIVLLKSPKCSNAELMVLVCDILISPQPPLADFDEVKILVVALRASAILLITFLNRSTTESSIAWLAKVLSNVLTPSAKPLKSPKCARMLSYSRFSVSSKPQSLLVIVVFVTLKRSRVSRILVIILSNLSGSNFSPLAISTNWLTPLAKLPKSPKCCRMLS